MSVSDYASSRAQEQLEVEAREEPEPQVEDKPGYSDPVLWTHLHTSQYNIPDKNYTFFEISCYLVLERSTGTSLMFVAIFKSISFLQDIVCCI